MGNFDLELPGCALVMKNKVDKLCELYDRLSTAAIDLFVVNKKAIKFMKTPELFSLEQKAKLFDELLVADWHMEQFLHDSKEVHKDIASKS